MAITSPISNSNKVPGIFLKVELGVGARAAGDSARYVVIFANKTSAGTAVVETEYDVLSEDDARTLGGAGSEAYWMCRAAMKANPGVALKLICITASGGTAATGTLVFAGTATAAGTVEVSVMGETIEVPYAVGDASTVVAAAVNTAINNKTDWPLTAGVVSSTVTGTARHAGPRGNFIAFRARIIDGAGITVTDPATDYLTSGATSDDPQNCLDVQTALRRTYLVAPYSDATQLAKFKTHLDAQDEPDAGNRKYCVWGSLDTLANTTTVATGLNFPRMQCGWLEKSDDTPGMVAAALAAFRAGAESTDLAHNYNGEAVPNLKPHYRSADVPSNTELNSALNNGITPLTSTNSGEVVIVRSVTCKSQDSAGKPDYRVLDTSKVVVPDFLAEDIELAIADRFGGFKASGDPADGESPSPDVLTPSLLRDLIFERLNAAEDGTNGYPQMLDNGSVAANAANTVVELSKIAAGRFNFSTNLDVVEWFNQAAGYIRQTG